MIFYPTLILGALGGAPSAVPAPPPVPFVLADETFESVSEEFDAAYRAWRRKPRNDRKMMLLLMMGASSSSSE